MRLVRVLAVAACLVLSGLPAASGQDLEDGCALPAGAGESCAMVRLGSVTVTTTGGLGQVAVHDGLAAVVQRSEGRVALIDVSDPAAPRVLGSYDGGTGQATLDDPLDGDVAFSSDGRYLFHARQTREFSFEGLHVLDVTDPTSPRRVDYAPAGGMLRIAYHAAGDAEYVVALDAVTGMTVYEFLRTPAGGTLVPVHSEPLPALRVGGPASAGLAIDPADPVLDVPLLYVTTGQTGLTVYDFSIPDQPRPLGAWDAAGLAAVAVHADEAARTVFAATEYWFGAQTPPRVVELDATDLGEITERWRVSPADPPFAGGIPWRVQGIHLDDGLLYVAHSRAGLGVLDAAALNALPRAATADLGERVPGAEVPGAPYAMDVTVAGGVVFVTDASTGKLSLFRLDGDH